MFTWIEALYPPFRTLEQVFLQATDPTWCFSIGVDSMAWDVWLKFHQITCKVQCSECCKFLRACSLASNVMKIGAFSHFWVYECRSASRHVSKPLIQMQLLFPVTVVSHCTILSFPTDVLVRTNGFVLCQDEGEHLKKEHSRVLGVSKNLIMNIPKIVASVFAFVQGAIYVHSE